MYMLLSGNPPFNGASDMHILEAVKKGEFTLEGGVWDDISDSAKDLVFNMLSLDPKNRISATDALAHIWIVESLETNTAKAKEKIHAALDNFRKFNSGNKLK